MVRKRKDGRYHILSEDGRVIDNGHEGKGYSKEEAEKRLREIEMFKHIKGKR